MMTDWSERMIKTLQLNGKGECTQESYVRKVRMLTEFYHKTPDAITEDELREYFLHRKNVSLWAPEIMRICYCGIRFFYTNVLQHDQHIFDILRAQTEHRLPAVLSHEEVRQLLACVNTPRNYAYLTAVYFCGLRLHEAIHLEVSDIDSARHMLHVHRGKGAKDRYVPLPESTIHYVGPTASRGSRQRGSFDDPEHRTLNPYLRRQWIPTPCDRIYRHFLHW